MKKINLKIKKFWGISEIGFSVMATTETIFFVYFLTDVAKLPIGITAVITGATALADAITAIIAGIIIDKVTFKNGKYRPWLIYCSPLVTLFFVLEFTKIGNNVLAGILISIGYILSHAIWNIAWTANRNLITKLSDSLEERSFLSGRIAAGSNAGKIIASYIVPTLSTIFIAFVSGITAYTIIAFIVCILFMFTYAIHYFITDGYDELDQMEVKRKAVTFLDMARGIATNPPLIAFLLHDAIRLIAFYGIAASAIYYAKIVLGDASAVKILLIFFYLGGTVGALLSKAAAVKLGGTKNATYFGVISFIICFGICYFLPGNIWLVGGFMCLSQILFGIAYGLTSNMYGMCGTYSEWKTGKDTRGVVMSFCSLAIKIGVALRGVIITVVLGLISYNPEGMINTAAQSKIKSLFIIMPIAALVISLIPLFFYKLDDKQIIKMEHEIIAKKA